MCPVQSVTHVSGRSPSHFITMRQLRNLFLDLIFLAVPSFVPTQKRRHCIHHSILGGVDVTVRHSDRTVTRDSGQRPDITTRGTQSSEECVPQCVQNEWPNLARLNGLPVLLLQG